MLLQDELAQTLGFIGIAQAQLIGVEALFVFFLDSTAQGNPLVA